MKKARLNNCNNEEEREYLYDLAEMTDKQLQVEWDSYRPEIAQNDHFVTIAQRKLSFISLELLDRGYGQKIIWVKA